MSTFVWFLITCLTTSNWPWSWDVPVRQAEPSKVSGLKGNPQPSITRMTNEKMASGVWEYIKSPLRSVQRSEMQSFPAGEGLWPRRKWCYMLVKQVTQPHRLTCFKTCLFESFLKRKGLETNSKETPHPCLQTQSKEGTLHCVCDV